MKHSEKELKAAAKRPASCRFCLPEYKGKGKWAHEFNCPTRAVSQSNPGKVVRLKNFTGVVRLNPNKTVSVVGRKKRSAKKR